MRVPDFLSAFTLNVVLALLSMIMAIVALALLLFVLAKDSYLKEASSTHRDKLKRHESFVVDFKDPSTIPDHFLQLNTLMFQKKTKNNLVTQIPNALPLPGMETMSKGNFTFDRNLPPLLTESEEVVSNKISSMLRAERSVVEKSIASSSPSSFVTDSGISDEDYSSDTRNFHDSTPRIHRTETAVESSGWTEEEETIEPLAQKITVDFECGSNASLC